MDEQNHELDHLANQNCILVDNNQLAGIDMLSLLDQIFFALIVMFDVYHAVCRVDEYQPVWVERYDLGHVKARK
eukprot:9414032-Ditylum_brightwellii.AAC.1